MPRVGADLRRRDFVDATVKVIAEHGVAGATTRRIAAAAGCPLATLHYVFHTKEDLFYAVYESLLEVTQGLTREQRGRPMRESAPMQLRRVMQWLANNPVFAHAQAELFNWALRFDPDLSRRAYELSLGIARAAYQEASDAPADGEVEALSRLTMTLIDGLLLSWFAQGDIEQLAADTEVACRTLTLVIDSFAARPPRRRTALPRATA